MKKIFFQKLFYYIIFFASFCLCFCLGGLTFLFKTQKTFLNSIIKKKNFNPSTVYDDQGKQLFQFSLYEKEKISLESINPIIIKAFIAIEDRTFFDHQGISIKGIIRSIIANIYQKRLAQGASTITQQLIRLLLLNQEKTIIRKLQELWYTMVIEYYYSKDQILEEYLNNAYFGAGIYGIKKACNRFWQKDPSSISIAQAATLAGIIQSPSRLCPLKFKDRALNRRNIVLKAMHSCNYINDQQYEEAYHEELTITEIVEIDPYAYIKEMVRKEVTKILGKKALYTDELSVSISINQTMQEQAYTLFKKHFSQLKRKINPDIDGGLICIDNKTGEIKSLIGGYEYYYSQFNRATQAHIQIGSTIKPLLFANAIMNNILLTSVEIDEPISRLIDQKLWNPTNYDKKFRGKMTLAYALAHSNNIVTIKTLEKITPETFVKTLKNFGILKNIKPYLSLALGCIELSLKEIAHIFMVFANNGQQKPISLVQSIKNSNNDYIWINTNKEIKRVIQPKIAAQIQSVLQHNLTYVYKKKLMVPAFGKTGTTNDHRTCLFVGSTPSWTTALYCGRDDNKSMGNNVFASRTLIPLWVDFNQSVNQPCKHFPYLPELQEITIHGTTGEMTTSDDPEAITMLIEKLNKN